ncbi:MAG TPA: hypothetical protein VKY31_05995 [Terriglobia bacterium]|nr:hypothetical protein [Terriglobia bacterium]
MTAATSQRNRRALIALGVAVAIYLISSQALLPLYDQLRASSGAAADKTEELRKYRRELSHRGNYEALKADARKKLDEVNTHFFTNDAAGTAELQRIIEEGAKTVGIDLMQRTTSQPRKIDDLASELTMTTTFEATPNQLVAFLNQLRNSSKIVNVRNSQIDPVQVVYEAPKSGDVKKTLRANLTIVGIALVNPAEKVK